ncbi:50S ribosomal protein L29 [Candidatus Saccharibacteria bacterium]|nr:50S ribosomal protein L29 [Candidatus Saccharibacteria bacterium]
MKTRDIRTKSASELTKYMEEVRQQIASTHIDMRTKEVKQVRQIRNLKKDLARALTIQSERELAELEKNNG